VLGQVLSHLEDVIARLFCFVGLKWHIAADQKLAPPVRRRVCLTSCMPGKKQVRDLIRTICTRNSQGLEQRRMPRGLAPCILWCSAITVDRVFMAVSLCSLIGKVTLGNYRGAWVCSQ
jgi:hypothetical protein